MDLLATRVGEHIRKANFKQSRPRVLVVDFSNRGDEKRSRLGVALADVLSESLATRAPVLEIVDRKDVHEFLDKNWLDNEELRNDDVTKWLGEQLHADGVVQGNLELLANGQLKVHVRVLGLGPVWPSDVNLILTDEMRELLAEPATKLGLRSEEIGPEAGVHHLDEAGITTPKPVCLDCSSPAYTDLARKLKYQGRIVLSAVLGIDGRLSAIRVVKAAPFDLTQHSIETILKWRMKPCEKDGKPVPVRLPIETTFRLY